MAQNPILHPKVQELRELSLWSEGQVWSSPELHGNVSGLMKTQIHWIPLTMGAVRPTQGRTLAVMQVSGGSQSFILLIRCEFWGGGCGCLRFPISHQWQKPIRNSMTMER